MKKRIVKYLLFTKFSKIKVGYKWKGDMKMFKTIETREDQEFVDILYKKIFLEIEYEFKKKVKAQIC